VGARCARAAIYIYYVSMYLSAMTMCRAAMTHDPHDWNLGTLLYCTMQNLNM
jgi:hypothetical protein